VQENHPPQQPQTRPTPPPVAPTAPGEASIDAIRNQWGRIKADVNAVNLRTGALMSEMDPVSLDGDRLILTVPYPFHASKMNSEDTRPVVEQVVSRVMGKPLKLECFTHEEYRNRPAPSGPSSHTATPASQPQEDAGPSDEPDPGPASHIDASESLKAVRNIFDAEEIVSPDR
jgi:hypothetical protein